MIHDEKWPAGTPAWADLNVPDHTAAQAFYTGVLGWEFLPDAGPEMGFYSMAHRGGKVIAGVAEGDGPPAWTTYLATDDIDATLAKVAEAGGTLLVGPHTIDPSGRFAVIADPLGAVVGLWQSAAHTGASLVNEPGAMIWNESYGEDFAAAKAFYGDVFGYGFSEMSGPGFEYVSFDLGDGRAVGGLGGPGSRPAGTAPGWTVYFATDDTEAAVARAVALGGSAVEGPRPSPFGMLATIAGPAGETFVLMSTTEPQSVIGE